MGTIFGLFIYCLFQFSDSDSDPDEAENNFPDQEIPQPQVIVQQQNVRGNVFRADFIRRHFAGI